MHDVVRRRPVAVDAAVGLRTDPAFRSIGYAANERAVRPAEQFRARAGAGDGLSSGSEGVEEYVHPAVQGIT